MPSTDPLQNPGPLQPVSDSLLADLGRRKLPETLQVKRELPAPELQAGNG